MASGTVCGGGVWDRWDGKIGQRVSGTHVSYVPTLAGIQSAHNTPERVNRGVLL